MQVDYHEKEEEKKKQEQLQNFRTLECPLDIEAQMIMVKKKRRYRDDRLRTINDIVITKNNDIKRIKHNEESNYKANTEIHKETSVRRLCMRLGDDH